MRIGFFGDSFVLGTGDPAGLGWVGRVCAAALRRGRDLTAYNLGIRGDSSRDVALRWRREAEARLPVGFDGRLMFAFGANDAAQGVPADETLAMLRVILAEAQGRPVLVLGPLPVSDDAAIDARAAALCPQMAKVCMELGVPYLPVFAVAAQSPDWQREAAANDGTHPGAAGYAALAEAVAAWPAWQAWVGTD